MWRSRFEGQSYVARSPLDATAHVASEPPPSVLGAAVPARVSPWPFACVFAVITALVVGLVAVTFSVEKHRYRERASIATENIARLLDLYLSDTFDRVDTVLQMSAHAYHDRLAGGRVDPDSLNRDLVYAQSLLPELATLRMTDRAGIVRYGQDVPAAGSVDLSDRDFFIRARDRADGGVVVSGPIFARISKTWVVVLARRLVDRDGAFAGIIYANVPTSYFDNAFATVALGPNGAATIRTADFALVHRVPAISGKIGSKDVSKELRRAIEARPDHGEYVAATAIDGIERSNAYRRLSDFPFYVIVGLATDDYLGGWQQNVQLVSGLAALVILVTGMAATFVFLSQRRVTAELAERVRIGHELERAATERSRLNGELAERARQAEAAVRAKAAFLANMSHELRTPLNAITGMSHLLKRTGLSTEQRQRVDTIAGAGQHLLELINAVLDLSRIEAGKVVMQEATLSVPAVLATVESMLAERAQAKGLHLVVVPPQPIVRVRGDATRLAQALLNYGANAVKFTETGSVTMRVEVERETDDDVVLRFVVEDTGVGIAPDVLPRLFAAFEQADNSLSRAHGGSGLGLAITRQLARLMGGDAGASSVPGQGSAFWFTARLRKAPPAGAKLAQVPAEAAECVLRRDFPGRRILLAEDDPINCEMVVELVGLAGLSIDAAADGSEAVERASRERYDLVLLDLQMPRLSGLDAAQSIRALPGYARTPIIALTANTFELDRAKSAAAGMDDFVAKPVDPELLFDALLRNLARSAGAAGEAPDSRPS